MKEETRICTISKVPGKGTRVDLAKDTKVLDIANCIIALVSIISDGTKAPHNEILESLKMTQEGDK